MEKKLVLNVIDSICAASQKKDFDSFSVSRDIFQARLDSFALKTNRYLESAIIGEIGNNTFDHNWDFKDDETRGAYFNFFDEYTVLADFGQGIRKTLSKVKSFSSDIDALKTAFTERLSGRAPEQRGNGLKFVLESFINKKWELYFQSGNACCTINSGIIEFIENDFVFSGCLAIMKF